MKSIITQITALAVLVCGCNSVNSQENQEPTKTDTKMMTITLNNDVQMPQFGLGLYLLADGDETYNSVRTALDNGYRHFDCAHAYRNERSLGRAIKDSDVPRDSIWVTSKLWPNEYGEGKTLKAIDRMLGRLGLEYIDLVYFHQPMGDFIGGWKEMEKALEIGKVRAIGISNFDVSDQIFDSLVNSAKVKPQIIQIECHPYAQRKHWQQRCAEAGIQIECWFPLGGRESKGEILRDSTINAIARNHGKSAAQIIIRWHLQEGFSVIPGTSNPDYIKENIDVFDFNLTDEEMQKIRALDKERRYFNMPYEEQVKWFSQWNPTD